MRRPHGATRLAAVVEAHQGLTLSQVMAASGLATLKVQEISETCFLPGK